MGSWLFTYSTDSNPILPLFILPLILFQLWPLGAPSVWHLCPFKLPPSFFWALLYFLAPHSVPGSVCIFLASALETGFCLRSPGFVYWRMVFRNQHLGSRHALCDWGIIALCGPGNTCTYTNTCRYIWLYLFLYLSIYVCVRGCGCEIMSAYWELHGRVFNR